MRRVILITAMLISAAGIARSTQTVYPSLTRQTLVGTWEAICGIGASPFVLHIVIGPSDSGSYLSEIYVDSMKGRLFRMEFCTVTDGKVTLRFRSKDGFSYWIEGDGYGDVEHAFIHARLGTESQPPGAGPSNLYIEKGAWIRRLGEASMRAAENINNVRDGKK
jgi:hypothetical protein